MRKISYKFLLVSSFICLCLAFDGKSIFGQCDIPGTPPCTKIKEKRVPRQPSRRRIPKSVNNLSTTVAEISKPGSIFKETSAGQTLIVKYNETQKELIFLVEALNQFSREKTGEIRLYVDLNRNSKIDISDIRYKIIKDVNGYKLQSFYLSGKAFSSLALVEYAFSSTKNQSRSHPIWTLKIPKTEIFFKSGEGNMRFEHWSEMCPDCIIRIPAYNITGASNIRDANGLLNFGPVKKLKFNP